VLRLTFALFGLLLLAKTVLHVRLYHYGFVLSAPALLATIAVLLCWLPNWIEARGGSGAVLRGAAIGAIAVSCGMYVYHDSINARQKTILVGSGADAFCAGAEGTTINRIVAQLKSTPAGSTVSVIPQGAMLNFLSGRASSIPFIVQMPPEVIMFSQQRILESLQRSAPDYVVYLDTETSEYGTTGYAADFGRPMFQWILENDRPIGGEPQNPDLKWLLYQRQLLKAPPPAPETPGSETRSRPGS